MNVAMILANGTGARMQANIPKQYLLVAGVPILSITIKIFDDCDFIDKILVVCDKPTFDEYIDVSVFSTPLYFTNGGNSRQESVLKGLEFINDNMECDICLIHDGVRAFTSQETVKNTIISAQKYGSGIAGVYSKDTIKLINEDMVITDNLVRNSCFLAQTPQTFDFKKILFAYTNTKLDNNITDDASVYSKHYKDTKIVISDYENIKITTKADLMIAELLYKKEL